MKLLLFIVIAGILVYFFLKFLLRLYRPFFLSRTFLEIDQIYSRLLTAADNDIDSAVENLKKWQSNDRVVRTMCSEDEIMKNIDAAKAAKTHEEELHEKFIRLKERFIGDPSRLSESIVAYRRYLEVKLRQHQDATLFARTSGSISFDEMMAAAKETMIVLEENEKKLDVLLAKK